MKEKLKPLNGKAKLGAASKKIAEDVKSIRDAKDKDGLAISKISKKRKSSKSKYF